MTFADVVTQLEQALRRELPGPAAQARLAPVPRREWPAGFNPARVRHAAGLLLVFPKPSTTINAEPAAHAESLDLKSKHVPRAPRLPSRSSRGDERAKAGASRSSELAHVVLTVRSDRVRHSGQISLPGGVVEPGETFEQAALREAHEEVALAIEPVRLLGALTPLDIPVSGFRLHPVVAVTPVRPSLTPADAEVAHILEVPVADLLDPATLVTTPRERDGIRYQVPAFHVAGREIWGATAMVLAEFLALLGWRGTPAD